MVANKDMSNNLSRSGLPCRSDSRELQPLLKSTDSHHFFKFLVFSKTNIETTAPSCPSSTLIFPQIFRNMLTVVATRKGERAETPHPTQGSTLPWYRPESLPRGHLVVELAKHYRLTTLLREQLDTAEWQEDVNLGVAMGSLPASEGKRLKERGEMRVAHGAIQLQKLKNQIALQHATTELKVGARGACC